jgi:hypothetical protein
VYSPQDYVTPYFRELQRSYISRDASSNRMSGRPLLLIFIPLFLSPFLLPLTKESLPPAFFFLLVQRIPMHPFENGKGGGRRRKKQPKTKLKTG